MKKRVRNIISWLIILFLGVSQTVYAKDEEELEKMIAQTAESIQNYTDSKEEYLLKDEENMPAGSSVGDWIAMVLAFSGQADAYEDYLERLEDYVETQYANNGRLDSVKATEYHRIALTMLALGGNPTSVEVQGEKVNLIADGTYDFSGETLGMQGANGLIYALLTLDSMKYEVPKDAKFTREVIVEELLACQCANGGFSLIGNGEGDVDITAMALQALAPYMEQKNVQEAVNKALAWLSEQMTESGTFVAYGNENVESTAQVVLALCALGIDPDTDERFKKGENSPIDGINYFRMENGMYMHTLSDGEADAIATYQSLLALEALDKLREEGTWILDFTDYRVPDNAKDSPVVAVAVIGVMLVIGSAIILGMKKNKHIRE